MIALHWRVHNVDMRFKSFPSTRTPLQYRRPRKAEYDNDDEEEEEEANQRERNLQIISLAPFALPDDWIVEEKPRPSMCGRVDRYYYEPGTGRKFRSLISVQRYLRGETREDFPTERVKSENEDTMQVVTPTRRISSSFKLPDDWIVEGKPRTNGNHPGIVDKTYIEPGSGRRFRSLRAVERYLNGEIAYTTKPKPLLTYGGGKKIASNKRSCLKAVRKRSTVAEDDEITLKALKLAIQSTHSKGPGSRRKINSRKNTKSSVPNFSSVPAKVNWVLSGPGGFWSPFIDKSVIPDSIKLKWSEAFILSIHNGNIYTPNC